VARSRHGTHPGIELGARDISTGRWSPSGLRSRSGSARRTSPKVLVARAGAAAGAEEAGTIAAGRSPVTRSEFVARVTSAATSMRSASSSKVRRPSPAAWRSRSMAASRSASEARTFNGSSRRRRRLRLRPPWPRLRRSGAPESSPQQQERVHRRARAHAHRHLLPRPAARLHGGQLLVSRPERVAVAPRRRRLEVIALPALGQLDLTAALERPARLVARDLGAGAVRGRDRRVQVAGFISQLSPDCAERVAPRSYHLPTRMSPTPSRTYRLRSSGSRLSLRSVMNGPSGGLSALGAGPRRPPPRARRGSGRSS
jgi:hypothetical protein